MIRATNRACCLFSILFFWILVIVPHSFGHVDYTDKELKYALRKLQPEKLRALLVESGYTEASLGDKLPSMVMEPNQDSERLKSGVTFPTECGTVYMHDFPNMQILNRTNPAFLEIRERVSFRKHGGMGDEMGGRRGGQAGGQMGNNTNVSNTERLHDSNENNDLVCQCDSYFCSCRKQCFCSLKAEPFDGQTVSPAAGTRSKPSNPDHQFKCTCSFDGVGGMGFVNGGTMDCDCKVADCACEKQCKCRKPIEVARPTNESDYIEPLNMSQFNESGLLTNNDMGKFSRSSSLHG